MSDILLTYDLETIAPTFVRTEDNKDEFPPLPFHEVIVACLLSYDIATNAIALHTLDALHEDASTRAQKEKALIKSAGELIEKSSKTITFNGRGFDAPLLAMRAMRHNVMWNFHWQRRHRFPTYKEALRHFDVMDQLTDYGACRNVKLNDICKMLGYPGKYQTSGGSVEAMFNGGEYEKIIQYCAEDVLQTWFVFLREGALHSAEHSALERYSAMYKKTVEWAREQPVFKEFFVHFDRFLDSAKNKHD